MLDYVTQLIRSIIQYRLDENSDYWARIKTMAESGMLSPNYCKALLYQIEPQIEELKDYPCYLHRAPEPDQLYAEGRPDIRLGALVDRPDLEVGIRLDGPLFVLVGGLIGQGKTIAVRVLLRGLHEYNLKHPDRKVSVIVFDRKGGDYADLPALFGWKHFHVYKSLRLALENPPGVPAQVWTNILCSAYRARTRLQFAEITLASEIRTLLGLMNRDPSARLNWPDPRLLLEALHALPPTCFSSKAEYTLSLIQALTAVVQSSYTTFEAFQGFRIDDLIDAGQSAVIAMPNMEPSWLRQFFVDLILLQLLKGRIERSERVDRTKVLFVVEEADADLHIQTESFFSSRMSPISECFKQGREFGIGGIAVISSLRSISPLVRENATTHIMFRAPDSIARDEAAQTLVLPPGGELTLDHLTKGHCLFKQVGPWPHAMVVRVDHMHPSRTKVTRYDTHPYIPSQSLSEMPQLRQDLAEIFDVAKKRQAAGHKRGLSHDAASLLKLAASHPHVPVARLFEKMGQLSFSRQRAIRTELEDAQLACFEEVRIGKVNMLLIEVTEAALKMLGLKLEPQENKGRGKLSHRTFAHWIKSHFEQKGYAAFIEGMVPGTNHPADVLLKSPDGKYSAVEICVTSPDNLLSHIQASFEASKVMEGMTVVTTTKAEARRLKSQTMSTVGFKEYAGRITFETIQKYIPRSV